MGIPRQLLTHICTINKYLGETPKGRAYDDDLVVPCRFERVKKTIRRSDGSEFVCQGKLFINYIDVESFPEETKITVDSETFVGYDVTLASGFSPSHWEVVLT